MDEKLFDILNRHGNADEYFFPRQSSYIKEGKNGDWLTFRRGMKTQSTIGGVRLNEWDPTGTDPSQERTCQYDLSSMVSALIELRNHDEYRGCVLSNEQAIAAQHENRRGKRIKFGFLNSSREKFAEDQYAAKQCHQNILKGIHRSGFRVVHPVQFDSATGMNGLHEWAGAVRLQRKRRLWPWLMLLLPLLLLFFIPGCEDFHLLDMRLRSQSFVLIIDRSGSMEEEIENVRHRMGIFLENLIQNSGFGKQYYGDVITYTNSAESALGGIREIDDNTADQLQRYLAGLDAGGDTWLQSAIELAAEEIREHQKSTTLFIITDAHEDQSIRNMIVNKDEVTQWFDEVDVYFNSTTPRIIGSPDQDTSPFNEGEEDLKEFTEQNDGMFGRMGKG